VVPQGSNDPSFRDPNGRLDLGLVPGFGDPGGDDDRPVVSGHVVIGGIDIRFIPAGFGNTGFEIVGDSDLAYPAKKGKGSHMGSNPGREILGKTCLDIRIAAGAQGGHKEIASLIAPVTGSVTGMVWPA